MKKLLLTLTLLLMISLTSGAQNAKRPNPRYRHHTEYSQSELRHHARHIPDYVGDVRFHVMGSIGQGGIIDLFRHRNPRMFTVGGMLEYQAGRAVSIGLGGEFYGSYCSWSRPYPDLDFYTYSRPVYGNLRLMIPTGEVRPFIEGRIGYAAQYNVHYAVSQYNTVPSKDDAVKIVKFERRLELALEYERFFDLVRWGDANAVINAFYSSERSSMHFLDDANFHKNQNEYLPVPLINII